MAIYRITSLRRKFRFPARALTFPCAASGAGRKRVRLLVATRQKERERQKEKKCMKYPPCFVSIPGVSPAGHGRPVACHGWVSRFRHLSSSSSTPGRHLPVIYGYLPPQSPKHSPARHIYPREGSALPITIIHSCAQCPINQYEKEKGGVWADDINLNLPFYGMGTLAVLQCYVPSIQPSLPLRMSVLVSRPHATTL